MPKLVLSGWSFRLSTSIAVGILATLLGVLTSQWVAQRTETPLNLAQKLLLPILSVLSVWIGTVLAFYFGRKKNTADLLSQLEGSENLNSSSSIHRQGSSREASDLG
jgi:ABC-type molybdate transport system permease subunit